MNSIAVIQARTDSSRLPGKVLLPISNIPLIVLAAKRAANKGRDVVVVISDQSTDDALSDVLYSYGIKYFRGSLENVLKRIVLSLSDYKDNDLVFRLTGDNVFPDGSLLDEIEDEFIKNNLNYICCNGKESGLPYGMSAELTRLGHLREAMLSTDSAYDLEHVTPYIRRLYGNVFFEKYKYKNKGHYRCTVDYLDDYILIQKIFSKVQDPVSEPSLNLIDILEYEMNQSSCLGKTSKLVVGGAQFGSKYGITNNLGKPKQEEVETIIKKSFLNGASYIDTANAYGDSEIVIGAVLKDGWGDRIKIVTKLSPLEKCPADASLDIVNSFVDTSVYKSLVSLKKNKIDVMMLHRVSHLSLWDGSVWKRLLEHKRDGIISALGASIQSPEELEVVLEYKDIEFIQLPFNILDWRWENFEKKILNRKKTGNFNVHVRSSLLQGLLTSNNKKLWKKANVHEPESILKWLEQQRVNSNSSSILELCIRYVNSISWVDGVVIGMESVEQLNENILTLSKPILSHELINSISLSKPIISEETLNPALWRIDYE